MQGGHRMKCVWGYTPPPLEYVEEWRDTKIKSQHQKQGIYVFCRWWTKDKSAAMPSLDNRQTRHVGRILAKCQIAKGHNRKQNQNVEDWIESTDRMRLWICCCVWQGWELFGQFWTLAALQLTLAPPTSPPTPTPTPTSSLNNRIESSVMGREDCHME